MKNKDAGATLYSPLRVVNLASVWALAVIDLKLLLLPLVFANAGQRIKEVVPLFLTIKRDWVVYDGTKTPPEPTTLASGRYEVERIPNPIGHDDQWLVLKGTKTGFPEKMWRRNMGPHCGLDQIVIEE